MTERIKERILKRFQCFKVHHPVQHLQQRRTTLPWRRVGRRADRGGERSSSRVGGTFQFSGFRWKPGVALTRVSWLVVKNGKSNGAAEQTGTLQAPPSTNGGVCRREEVGVLPSRLPHIHTLIAQTGSFIRQIKDLLRSPPAGLVSIRRNENKRPLHQSEI